MSEIEAQPEVRPCPPECAFDWADFHHKLDIALAHMIEERGARPSETTVMALLFYSYAKHEATSR